MRVLGVIVVLLFAGWLGGDSAWAEKAKAKETAKIYNRAGEQGQVVIKVKEGQVMRIVKTEGRWYKVNVSGRTGWIPRSKVDVIGGDDMVRNTRRRPFVDGRSTKRGFGGQGGPDDRVGADAVDGATKGGGDDGSETGGDDGDEKPTKKPTKKPAGDDGDGDEKPTKPTKPTKKSADDGDTDGEEPKVSDEGEEVGDTRPKAKVKKKTAIYSEPDDESETSFTATTSMSLRLTGKKKGKYVEVENDEADIGYVLESSLEVSDADTGPRGGPARAQIDVRGRLGFMYAQQGMRTVGTGAVEGTPDNYNLKTSAAMIALGGQYLRPYSKAYVIGAELTLDIAKAVPGITELDGTSTGITMYNVNARAMFGKDFKKKSGMMAFGRLGFRFNSYQIANVGNLMENSAKIPSEIIKAPTVGGALAFPRLTEKVGLRFSLDAILVAAALQQTKGLEDGDARNVKGANLGAGMTYKWKKRMDINATYDLNYLKFDFGTPSPNRGHMGTSVGRTDIFHGVTVGVAMAL